MNEAESSLSGVSALMAQRQKYEEWLAALDARRATTPQHVFERVRGDYEKRLQVVLDQLATHRGELEIQAQTLSAQLTSLQTEERQRRDERDELDLRAHVGELSADGYAAAVKALDDTLGLLSGRQASIATELDRTRQFLTATSATPGPAAQPPAPVAPAPRPAPQPVAHPPFQPVARPAPPPIPQAPPAPAPMAAAPPQAPAPNFDELAFLNSVVGPNARRRGEEPPTSPMQATSAPGSGDDLTIARDDATTLGDSLLARVAKQAQDNNIIRQEPTDALSGARGRAGAANAPLAANITGNNPIVLRQSGGAESANQKTLKCSECGSMNYPTEWYCERCGAELASL